MSPTAPYRGRFAPSPTGPLHLGSLLAALGSWLLARHAGGAWVVRIEDLDPPREVAGAAALQLETLAAFGMASDETVTYQSQRGALYHDALEQLQAAGHAFACRCTRRDLAPRGGIHRACVPGRAGRYPAIRLRVPPGTRVGMVDGLQGLLEQSLDELVGDFVIRRADGLWAYQLAVVVDDAEQCISDVVRGCDLLDSTPRQILLQRLLGLPTPRYLHLPVVRDESGGKLSKSQAAVPVDGEDPLPALRAAWAALGQPTRPALLRAPSARWLAAMQPHFEPSRLRRTLPPAAAATCGSAPPTAGRLLDT